MKSILKYFLSLLAFTTLCVTFDGCVVWDFISVRYQNVTGYFNTYYNASALFKEAEDEMKKEEENKDVQVEKYNPFILTINPTTLQKFDKVIDKCSRILNFYSESKWVDNSLLLIGKCYYYRQEFGRAERKFKELMETFPKSDLVPEAQLWLGKTYFMMERDEDAFKTVQSAIDAASEAHQSDIIGEGYFALGDMTMFLNKQSETVEHYKKGVSYSKDSQRKARIQYTLAKLEEKLGHKEAARNAYLHVLDFEPQDKLKFNAELQYVKLSRELGDINAAFNTLVQMLATPRYFEYEAQIQLQIAHTLAASGDYKTAIEQYVWVDTTFKGKPEAAEGYYSVARLYEYQMKDYDHAAENYGKAKFEYPGSEFALKGGRRAEDFTEYRNTRNQMSQLDTLLFYVLNPDSLVKRDSLKTIHDSLDLAEKIRNGYDPNNPDEKDRQSRLLRRKLHGRNTGKVSIHNNPQQSIPGVPGSNPQAADGSGQAPNAQPLYRTLKISTLKPDSVSSSLGLVRYNMGDIMYSRLQNNDSARYYYQLALLDNIPDKDAAHALFTMAQMSREEGDSLRADSLEMVVIKKYPRTPFGVKLMTDRNMPISPDSLSMALDAYNIAAKYLESGQHELGISEMKKVIERYPFSEQAVRARFAIGLTYERDLMNKDKMLTEYKQIIKDYPNSKYSQRPREIFAALDEAAKEKAKPVVPSNKPVDSPKEDILKDRGNIDMGVPLDKLSNPAADSTGIKIKPAKKDPTQDPDFPLNPIPSPPKLDRK